jgi:heptosyltransferase-2
MTEDGPSQILVVRLGSIGDVLLATPLVRVLRRRYPRTLLRFLVKAPYAPLLERNPHLDQVMVWPADDESATPPWNAAALRLAADTRARRPLWVVDLQASPRSVAFALLLRPDRTFRYRKDYLRRALLVRAKIDRYPRPIPSIAERYFAPVRALGLVPDGGGLDLVLGGEEERRAGEMLNAAGSSAGATSRSECTSSGSLTASSSAGCATDNASRLSAWLAVAPGARWATKRWPPDSFAVAAHGIAAPRGWGVVLLGSREDASVAGAVRRMLEDAAVPALDLTGRLLLIESAAVIQRCSLLLSNDSGLMHVAAALRVPTVALFGSTVPQFGFAPYHAPARVLGVEGLPCRPCTHIGRRACPLGHFRCMRDLAPGDAVSVARELLAEGRATALQASGGGA